MIAFVIGRRVGHVSGGIDIFVALYLEVAVHVQTALTVARRVNLCGQAARLDTNCPDDGL